MDMKSSVKKRRKERIRTLLATPLEDSVSNHNHWDKTAPVGLEGWQEQSRDERPLRNRELPEPEPDPEQIWKQQSTRWIMNTEDYPGGTYKHNRPPRASFWKMFVMRSLVSTLLFGALWGIHKYQPDWSLPIRSFVAKALSEEIDFTAAQVWYEEHFGGAPSFIPIFGQSEDKGQKVQGLRIFSSPIPGTVSSPFALSLKGVEVVPKADLSSSPLFVKSVETGRVAEVTQDVQTGLTVQIQHADGYYSVYGHLGEATVQKGDWIEGGEGIGTLKNDEGTMSPALYFALKKDGQYIDPSDVVPFD